MSFGWVPLNKYQRFCQVSPNSLESHRDDGELALHLCVEIISFSVTMRCCQRCGAAICALSLWVKVQNCYRMCQNHIMISLCHYLFLFVFFLLSFVLICLSVDISKNAGKFIFSITVMRLVALISLLYGLIWFLFLYSDFGHFLVALFTLCGFVNAMDWGEWVRGLSLVWNTYTKEEVWSVSFNMPPLLLQLSTAPITLSLDLFLVFYNLQHPGVHASESSSLHIVIIILQLEGTIQSFPISSRLIFFSLIVLCIFSCMVNDPCLPQKTAWKHIKLRIVLCSHQYIAMMV